MQRLRKKELSNYEKELNLEIETRLTQLEQSDYDYGKAFNKWDWFFVCTTVLVGLAITLWGIL